MAVEMFNSAFAVVSGMAQDGFASALSYQPLVEQTMFAEQVPYITPLFEVRNRTDLISNPLPIHARGILWSLEAVGKPTFALAMSTTSAALPALNGLFAASC
jgi:hypothetical protein